MKAKLLDTIQPIINLDDSLLRTKHTLTFIYLLTESLFQSLLDKYPLWLTSTSYGRSNAVSITALFGKVTGAHWPLSPKSELHEIGSLCAGLPHFSEGIWRCWGRDTLISLRGSLLLTGRLNEATAAIIAFGSTVRHGLVPNLLGEGKVSRFNCRDATWFWLNSVKDTYEFKEGILHQPVPQGFVTDSAEFDIKKAPMRTVLDVVYEIIERHGEGIHFIERNAGPKIDMNMDQRYTG